MFSLWLHDFLEDEFKFWEIVDRKSGRGEKRKEKIPTDADHKKKKKKKKKKSPNKTDLKSGNCALCWSAEITNPRSCVQGRKVSSSPECIIQEKRFNNTWTSRSGRRASEKSFFSSLLSACLHTLQRGGGGTDILPGAAPLMSAATWAPGSGDAVSLRPCVSKAAAAKWRQYRPHVDTWGTCNICAPLYYHIRNYASIMFTMTFC